MSTHATGVLACQISPSAPLMESWLNCRLFLHIRLTKYTESAVLLYRTRVQFTNTATHTAQSKAVCILMKHMLTICIWAHIYPSVCGHTQSCLWTCPSPSMCVVTPLFCVWSCPSPPCCDTPLSHSVCRH